MHKHFSTLLGAKNVVDSSKGTIVADCEIFVFEFAQKIQIWYTEPTSQEYR